MKLNRLAVSGTKSSAKHFFVFYPFDGDSFLYGVKRMKSLLATLALGLLVSVGCSQSSGPAADVDAGITKVSTVLCGACGEVKGSDQCCAADADVCDCGLHKGSPGCCKIEKGTDVTLCSKCGEVADGEKCCAEGAEVCACGAHKGAPGCCLKKSEASAAKEDGSGTKDDEDDEEESDEEDDDGSATKAEETVEDTADAA